MITGVGARHRGAALMLALAGMICVATLPARALGACTAPTEIAGLERAPEHIRDRIARKLPLKIVAIGSSSTSGFGASSSAATYPARLEQELKARLPGLPITVLNKGVGGEEAPQMVARFDADVIEESPDLVIWQVGSNSVLRDHPTPGEIIRQGVERLKSNGFEVILINPQYAPKILAKPDVDRTVDVITATARDAEVGLFDRFHIMRHWVEGEKLPFEKILSADGLHLNDWSYACTATLLADAILEGAKLPQAMAAPGNFHRQ
jgi:acyl-CoA thioesterase-1